MEQDGLVVCAAADSFEWNTEGYFDRTPRSDLAEDGRAVVASIFASTAEEDAFDDFVLIREPCGADQLLVCAPALAAPAGAAGPGPYWTCVAWSPDGEFVAVGAHDGVLQIWRPGKGSDDRPTKHAEFNDGTSVPICRICWTSNTSVSYGTCSGTVVHCDVRSEKDVTITALEDVVTAIAWTAGEGGVGKGNRLAMAHATQVTVLLDRRDTRDPSDTRDTSDTSDKRSRHIHDVKNVRTLAWSKGGQQLAVGTSTDVQIWSLVDDEFQKSHTIPINARVSSMSFLRHAADTLVVCDESLTVKLISLGPHSHKQLLSQKVPHTHGQLRQSIAKDRGQLVVVTEGAIVLAELTAVQPLVAADSERRSYKKQRRNSDSE
jgi:WD40 repeat protein